MQLVTPLKFCITIVFDFAWDDCNTQDELETIVMQEFCVMVHVKLLQTESLDNTILELWLA